MTDVTQPTGRPPGHFDLVSRAALVLVLLGLAAHGLSGRRDLDWSSIDDTPQSPWVGLLLAAVAGALVVVAARSLMRTMRAASGALDDDDELPDIEGRPLPRWLIAAAVLFLVAVLVGIYEAAQWAVAPVEPVEQGAVATDLPATADGQQPPVSGLSLLALLLGGAAVLLYLGARLLASRRATRPTLDGSADGHETTGDSDETTVLAVALQEAGGELARHDEDRTAILAAYDAMERRLAAAGATRRASDTPTDFLHRAVRAAGVSRGAATTLTELFREARVSTHPMPPDARGDAARALARVSADLADVRA
jgi:Domain of unknown function (DUF4129)